MKGRLTAEEVAEANALAANRSARNRARGNSHRFGMRDRGEERDREGAQSELFVARRLAVGVEWPLPDDVQGVDGDVGPLEVRSTTRDDGRLVLHDSDVASRPYVLVINHCPDFTVPGFYKPQWGLDRKWWEVHRAGGGAYYVPRDKLAATADLPTELLGLNGDLVRRVLGRRFTPEADAYAVKLGIVCHCGAAADLVVDRELRCNAHAVAR